MMTERRYDFDALRVIAFMLLIVYHVAMYYVADWGWHIKSDYQYEWLKVPMLLVNQWRMSLLFIVSGFACHFLMQKYAAGGFMKQRSTRLLIPFITGVILVVPPQAYIQATANGSIHQAYGEMNYWQFLWHYFSFRQWPFGAFDGSEYGFTWNHLWFIPYIFAYSVCLIPLQKLLHYCQRQNCCYQWNLLTIIIFPIGMQIIWRVLFSGHLDITHAFFDDFYAHAMYGTYFILGFFIAGQSVLWQGIIKIRWEALISAGICFTALSSLWWWFKSGTWLDHAFMVIVCVNQWLWLLAILAWSARLLNKPVSWITFANKRVYPWYIFHQTITILAAYYLSPFSIGGPMESLMVLLITILGCLGMTELIIRKSEFLKAAFGMTKISKKQARLSSTELLVDRQ